MGGLPCAKEILDNSAYINGQNECFQQACDLRLRYDEMNLSEAEQAAVEELLKQARKAIKEAGKIVSGPFSDYQT